MTNVSRLLMALLPKRGGGRILLSKTSLPLLLFIFLGTNMAFSQAPQCMQEGADLPKVIAFDQFMGINLRRADPIEFAACVGNAREYHNWDIDEVNGSIYPNNEYEFHPTNAGQSVITSFDNFYQSLIGVGVDVCATLVLCSEGVSGVPNTNEPPSYVTQNYQYCPPPPVVLSDAPLDPFSYEWRADYVTQYVHRYGGNPTSPLSADQDKNTGSPAGASSQGLITYLENWNEEDNFWDPVAHFSPEVYATMSSVDYDGFAGFDQFGSSIYLNGQNGCSGTNYPLGLTATGSSISFVMGGLSNLDECYLEGVMDWFQTNRTGLGVVFPFDVLNFHHYSDGGFQSLGVGISPEEDGLQAQLKRLDLIRDNLFPDKEIWLSEFGYNTLPGNDPISGAFSVPTLIHPNNPDDADSYEVQGQWIVRSFLAIAAADFDKAFVYEIRDATDNPIGSWDLKCGLLESLNAEYQPKKSWYYTYTLKNVLGGMDYDSEFQAGSLDCADDNPRIYKFVNPGNPSKEIYAIWSPTSCNKPTYDFTFNIGGFTAAQYTRMQVPSITGIVENAPIVNGQITVPVSERPIFVCLGQAPISNVDCSLNVMVDNITCSSVTLFWDIPTGMDYDRYQLWYGPASGIADPNNPDIFTDDITLFEHNLAGTATQAFIGELVPLTDYYFYLIPHSENNSTSWCTPIMATTTDEGCNIEIDYATMVTLEDASGNPFTGFSFAPNLFDDQNEVPEIGCCWLPEGNAHTYDNWIANGETVVIDLGEPYDIDVIYLYDGTGVGAVTIEYETAPGVWEPYVEDYVTSLYLKWVTFANDVPPCAPIQKLRVRAALVGDQIGELVFCGKPMTKYDINGSFTYTDNCPIYPFQSHPDDAGHHHYWDFGDSFTSDEANPVHEYSDPGMYDVKHTVSNLCNEVTTSETIDVGCLGPNLTCPCTGPNGINIGQPGQTTLIKDENLGFIVSSKCVAIAGTLIIDKNTQFIDCELRMQPGSEIIVQDGHLLYIWGSTPANSVIHGCQEMWKGITVQQSALLWFWRNTIKDAQYAIHPLKGAKINVHQNYFDNNFIGIHADAAGGSVLLQYHLYDNHFISTGNLLSPYNGQSPPPGQKTYAGIYLNQVQGFSIGLEDDPSLINHFDGIRNGVVAVNSAFDMHHTQMANLLGEMDYPTSLNVWDISGIGLTTRYCVRVDATHNIVQTPFRGVSSLGSNLEFKDQNVINSGRYGITIWNADNKTIEIIDNHVNIESTSFGAGIGISSALSAELLDISENTIELLVEDHPSRAVSIGYSSPSELGNAQLFDNDVSVNIDANSIFFGSSKQWKIKENTINAFGGGNGIYLGNSNQFQVRENTITGNGTGTFGTSLGQVGINAFNSPDITYCCNNVNQTKQGIAFQGPCGPSVVGTTQFNNHRYGLFYQSSGVTGLQEFTGNEWLVNCVAEDAYHAGGNAGANQSRYNVDDSQIPNDAFPSLQSGEWFTVFINGQVNTCSNWVDCGEEEWLSPGINDFEIHVMDGDLRDLEHGEVVQWLSEQHLYAQLLENPALTVGNAPALAFKNAKAVEDIGQLYTVQSAMENAWKYPEPWATEMRGHYTIISEMMGQLDSLNGLLAQATPQETVVILDVKETILSQLDSVAGIERTTRERFLLYAKDLLTIIRSQNDNLELSYLPAVNEQSVNRLLMDHWINDGVLTATQIDQLYDVGVQCPLIGGNAVFRARGLHDLATGFYTDWEQLEDCTPLDERSGSVAEEAPEHGFTGKIRIEPNPAKGSLTVVVGQQAGFSGEAHLLDAKGIPVRQKAVASGKNRLDLSGLPPGLYFALVKSGGFVVHREKIVVLD